MVKRHPVARNLELTPKIFGFDTGVFIVMFFLTSLIWTISGSMKVGGITFVALAVFFWFFQKGKPRGYLIHLIKWVQHPKVTVAGGKKE